MDDNLKPENPIKEHVAKVKEPPEEFLHTINLDMVFQESGLDMDGLCKFLNLDYQTINRWTWPKSRKGNRPKYNAVIRLLRMGVTTKTLFGVETKSDGLKITNEDISKAMIVAAEILKNRPEESVK